MPPPVGISTRQLPPSATCRTTFSCAPRNPGSPNTECSTASARSAVSVGALGAAGMVRGKLPEDQDNRRLKAHGLSYCPRLAASQSMHLLTLRRPPQAVVSKGEAPVFEAGLMVRDGATRLLTMRVERRQGRCSCLRTITPAASPPHPPPLRR
ncbi:hypothetical protein BRAS3809_6640007 [Bradyrhizobium sp. STM 3809]|nr:hypothetical protein BRAS3809_6640007 [Bradyrhizobium sp. STM 3809]